MWQAVIKLSSFTTALFDNVVLKIAVLETQVQL